MTQTDRTHDAPVLFEQRGDVGLILLNDSHRRNALCADLAEGVLDVLTRSRRSGVRALVIGSNAEVFCAGADIREMLDSGWLTASDARAARATPLDLFEALEADGRPVIAAVNGIALGGGVELVLACDLAVAARTASFALPELGLGVLPNTALGRLAALVGQRVALDLIWTRRRLTATEALHAGLVNRVAEPDQLLEQAVALAESIVGRAPPAAITAAKRHLPKGNGWREIRAVLNDLREAEWTEGFSAFLEKRKPNYESFWSEQ